MLDARIDRLLRAINETLQFLVHILRGALVKPQEVKVIFVEQGLFIVLILRSQSLFLLWLLLCVWSIIELFIVLLLLKDGR